MSVKTAEAVMAKFLTGETSQVLALTGAWGVGKTFAWNTVLRKVGAKAKPSNYAYVSLFGITSMAQLRTAIMVKAQAVDQLDKPLGILSADRDWLKRIGPEAKNWGANLMGLFGGGAIGKGLNFAIETLAPFVVKDTIVCLDDFERLKAVTAEEILGLVSELKEEHRCKIVLIFNAGELAKNLAMKDSYATYKEKVIDVEVSFAPTAMEAFDLAFEDGFPNRALIFSHVQDLGVTNIRILRKMQSALSTIVAAIGSVHADVTVQAISTTVLLCWCAYAPESAKPKIEDIGTWNDLLWGSKDPTGAPAAPEAVEWAKRFKAYGFQAVDELDIAIAKCVARGYVEDSGLLDAAGDEDKAAKARELDNDFSDAWAIFHNSFADDADEFVRKVFESAKRAAPHMSPMNLDSTVRVLRELEQSNLASDLIGAYVESHEDRPYTFDLAASRTNGRVEDEEVKERFIRAHMALVALPTLEDAALSIGKNTGWNNQHIEALGKATIDDFYELFIRSHGNDHHDLVKGCLIAGSPETQRGIREKATEALKRIGATSALNAERVKAFGI